MIYNKLHIFKVRNLMSFGIYYTPGKPSPQSSKRTHPSPLEICNPSLPSFPEALDKHWSSLSLPIMLDFLKVYKWNHKAGTFLSGLFLSVQIFWDSSQLFCVTNLFLFIASSIPLYRYGSAIYIPLYRYGSMHSFFIDVWVVQFLAVTNQGAMKIHV